MDLSEKRILGSLLLLAGVTFLSIALATNQLSIIMELIRKFEPAIAGLP
jgi:hypothetical protein